MQVCRSTGSLSWVAACGPLAGALVLAISALAAPAVRAETPVWFEVHLVPQFGPNRIPIGLGGSVFSAPAHTHLGRSFLRRDLCLPDLSPLASCTRDKI